jgi:hypothetical protein
MSDWQQEGTEGTEQEGGQQEGGQGTQQEGGQGGQEGGGGSQDEPEQSADLDWDENEPSPHQGEEGQEGEA